VPPLVIKGVCSVVERGVVVDRSAIFLLVIYDAMTNNRDTRQSMKEYCTYLI
jgi:hypothetical protein